MNNYVGMFVKTYYCCMIPGCPKSYTSRYNLMRHVRNKHQKSKEITCPKCNRSFSSKQNLREHMNIHEGTKPFECKDCGMEFRQSSQLSIHKRAHKLDQIESDGFEAICLLKGPGSDTSSETFPQAIGDQYMEDSDETTDKYAWSPEKPLILPNLRKSKC